jgi:sulfonate transport system substrate-binding protein
MRRPQHLAGPAILGAVALLAGCSLAGASGGAASGGAPTAPTASGLRATPSPLDASVALRIGVFPNVTHAPGLVELAPGGQLSQLLPNADIQVSAFNSGTTAIEALFSDAIDATFIGPNPTLNAFAKSHGEALRVICGSTSGGAFLVVRNGINRPADLRGTTLATPSLGNTQDVALRSWLASQGFSTDAAGGGDVSVAPLDNARTLEAFEAGTIDGAWVPEPWATRLVVEGGGHVLVDERDLWPGGRYLNTHLVVATSYLGQHPDVVERLVLATVEAVDFVNDQPTAAQAIVNDQIERYTSKQLGVDLLSRSWANLTFTVDPLASTLQQSAADAEALGLLDDPGDLASLYDLDVLNGILGALGRPAVEGLTP